MDYTVPGTDHVITGIPDGTPASEILAKYENSKHPVLQKMQEMGQNNDKLLSMIGGYPEAGIRGLERGLGSALEGSTQLNPWRDKTSISEYRDQSEQDLSHIRNNYRITTAIANTIGETLPYATAISTKLPSLMALGAFEGFNKYTEDGISKKGQNAIQDALLIGGVHQAAKIGIDLVKGVKDFKKYNSIVKAEEKNRSNLESNIKSSIRMEEILKDVPKAEAELLLALKTREASQAFRNINTTSIRPTSRPEADMYLTNMTGKEIEFMKKDAKKLQDASKKIDSMKFELDALQTNMKPILSDSPTKIDPVLSLKNNLSKNTVVGRVLNNTYQSGKENINRARYANKLSKEFEERLNEVKKPLFDVQWKAYDAENKYWNLHEEEPFKVQGKLFIKKVPKKNLTPDEKATYNALLNTANDKLLNSITELKDKENLMMETLKKVENLPKKLKEKDTKMLIDTYHEVPKEYNPSISQEMLSLRQKNKITPPLSEVIKTLLGIKNK